MIVITEDNYRWVLKKLEKKIKKRKFIYYYKSWTDINDIDTFISIANKNKLKANIHILRIDYENNSFVDKIDKELYKELRPLIELHVNNDLHIILSVGDSISFNTINGFNIVINECLTNYPVYVLYKFISIF